MLFCTVNAFYASAIYFVLLLVPPFITDAKAGVLRASCSVCQ